MMGWTALPTMKATMEDIARECGVTKMTVSRVLTGKDKVKSSTRLKILAAASRLNYEINTLAQNFNLNRSGFVGVATPFDGLLGSSYFAEVFQGFDAVLKDTDWNFALFDTRSASFDDGAKLARLYRQRRVDGLLVVAAHTTDQFIGTLEHLRIPMVVVGEQVLTTQVCSISCHDAKGITILCEHLYGMGHRRIAFVEGPPNFLTATRRKKAYLNFCAKHELRVPAAYCQPGDFTMRSGRSAGHALLTTTPRPTAVIAANDVMAFGVVEAGRALGLEFPGDVSVAGFDDLPTAADRTPSLTTIHQPVYQMGELSARTLVNAMLRSQNPTGQTILDVSLMVRESTRPPRPARRTSAPRQRRS